MFCVPELFPNTPKVLVNNYNESAKQVFAQITRLWYENAPKNQPIKEFQFGPLEITTKFDNDVVSIIMMCNQDLSGEQYQNEYQSLQSHNLNITVIAMNAQIQHTLDSLKLKSILATNEQTRCIFDAVIDSSYDYLKNLETKSAEYDISTEQEIMNLERDIRRIGQQVLTILPFQVLQSAKQQLKQAGTHIFPIILNDVQNQKEADMLGYSYKRQRIELSREYILKIKQLKDLSFTKSSSVFILRSRALVIRLYCEIILIKFQQYIIQKLKFLFTENQIIIVNNKLQLQIEPEPTPSKSRNEPREPELNPENNIFTFINSVLESLSEENECYLQKISHNISEQCKTVGDEQYEQLADQANLVLKMSYSQEYTFIVQYLKLIMVAEVAKIYTLAFYPLCFATKDIIEVAQNDDIQKILKQIVAKEPATICKDEILFVNNSFLYLTNFFTDANQITKCTQFDTLQQYIENREEGQETVKKYKPNQKLICQTIQIYKQLFKDNEFQEITGAASLIFTQYIQLQNLTTEMNNTKQTTQQFTLEQLTPDVIQKQVVNGKFAQATGSLQEHQLQMKAVCYASNLMVSRILDFGNMFAASKNQTSAFKYFQAQMYIKRIQLNPEQLEPLKEIISTNYQELIFGDEEMLNEQQQAQLIRELVEFSDVDSQLAARMYVRLLYLQKRFPQDNLSPLIQSVEKQITEEVQIAVSTPLKRVAKLELVQTEPNSFLVNLETEKIIEHEDVKTGFRLSVDGQEVTVAEPSFKYSCKQIHVLKLIYTAKLGKVTAVVEQDLDHRYYQHMSAAWKIVRGPLLTKLSTSTQSPLELAKPEHVFVGQDNEVRFSRAASLTVSASEPQGVYYKNAQNEYVEIKEAFQLETDAITLFASQPCTVFFTDAADQKQLGVQIVAPFTIMQYVTDLLNNQFMVKTVLRPTQEITIRLEQLQTEFDVQLLNEPTILLNSEVQIVQIIDGSKHLNSKFSIEQVLPTYGDFPNLLIHFNLNGKFLIGFNNKEVLHKIMNQNISVLLESDEVYQNQPCFLRIKILSKILQFCDIEIEQEQGALVFQNYSQFIVLQPEIPQVITVRFIAENLGRNSVMKVTIKYNNGVIIRQMQVLVK
ncbi:Hypothetical_protein [Hexamita inflata]|uniref:Hypothetical_protein n=1 Tax=Hexamita inflata TaxID=28002 RepID=A0AA86PXG4_9EUKA|nr:Hypothetical protein HINF_LOCUS29829 [Hexamita inflata]